MPVLRSAQSSYTNVNLSQFTISNTYNQNNSNLKKRTPAVAAASSFNKISSYSANNFFNSHQNISKLKINGVRKLQYITDSIWSYNPEYFQQINKTKNRLKSASTWSKKTNYQIEKSYLPGLSGSSQYCALHSNFYDEQTQSLSSIIKLPDLNLDLENFYPPPHLHTHSTHTSTSTPIQMIPEPTTTTTGATSSDLNHTNSHQMTINEQIIFKSNDFLRSRHQRHQLRNGLGSAKSQQVYTHIAEPTHLKRNPASMITSTLSGSNHTNNLVLSAASKLNKTNRKKTFLNITSSYAIENDNLLNGDIVKLNDDKASDEYYDYLELKNQLFNSSLKTSNEKATSNDNLTEDETSMTPAKLRLNNLNKNLHSLIRSKRLKSAGGASTSSAATAAFFEENLHTSNILSNTSPRQQQQLKQPQILNMKFKSGESSASTSSQKSKSKPGSASTFHSGNRSANSNKSFDSKTNDLSRQKIVIYGKHIDNLTTADLLSVLSDGINKKMLQMDETSIKRSKSPYFDPDEAATAKNTTSLAYLDRANTLNGKSSKSTANLDFFELNYDEDFDDFNELEDEDDYEEDIDYEDEDYYEFLAAAARANNNLIAPNNTDNNEENTKEEQTDSNNDDQTDETQSKETDSNKDENSVKQSRLVTHKTSRSTQVNLDEFPFDDDYVQNNAPSISKEDEEVTNETKPIKKPIVIPGLPSASTATIISSANNLNNNESKKSAGNQILNAQKRMKLLEQQQQRRNKQIKIATTNSRPNRVKSAKSEKSVSQMESIQSQTNLSDVHMQPEYISKQNRIIMNKIKNYSKNADIEMTEANKMRKDFASNFFDSKRDSNRSTPRYADVISEEFRQILNKYDTTYSTADQFIRQHLPPPEYYMYNSYPAKESDNSSDTNSVRNFTTSPTNQTSNNNTSIDMYNLLKRMLVKKKYVMHTIRQENINANARLRMKRLFQQQQQQQQQVQQQQITSTASNNNISSLTCSAQQQPQSISKAARPSTAAISESNENNTPAPNQQSKLQQPSRYRLNRPKTASSISVRQQSSSSIVDLSSYEVVNSKPLKQPVNNNNRKVGQTFDDENFYEQFRLSPTTMNTQSWPYELDFDRYVKRRNMINRLKTVKLFPYKKLPLVKIELQNEKQQQQQQQTESTQTQEGLANTKLNNLKSSRPLTATRSTTLIKQQLVPDNELNKTPTGLSDYRRCTSTKPPQSQIATRGLIKITFDPNNKQSLETLENVLNDNTDEYLIEQDDANLTIHTRTNQSVARDEKTRLRTQNRKAVTIDETTGGKRSNELKIPICTCHIVSTSKNSNHPQAVLQPLTLSMLQHQSQRRPNNLTKMNIDHMQFKKLAMQHQEEIYSLLDTTNATATLAQVSTKKGRINYRFSDVYVPAASHAKLDTSRSNRTTNSNKTKISTNSAANNVNANNNNNADISDQTNDLPNLMYKQSNQLLVKTSRRPKTAKI